MENGTRINACKILDLAREVLTIEAEGLTTLIAKLDISFVKAVDLMYQAKGRVIVTGVGKSGIVARKIVATFNSTGTPALFLHPVEAMHGDLGMVSAPRRGPGPVQQRRNPGAHHPHPQPGAP